MKKIRTLKFDEIGYWSELKLDIVRKYAAAYSTILTALEKLRVLAMYQRLCLCVILAARLSIT